MLIEPSMSRQLCFYEFFKMHLYFGKKNNDDDDDHNNKDQSNLAKAGSLWQIHPTPPLYSPGGSIVLTVCHNFQLHVLTGGSTPNLPFPWGHLPHITQCVIGPHKRTCQMASNTVERLKYGA